MSGMTNPKCIHFSVIIITIALLFSISSSTPQQNNLILPSWSNYHKANQYFTLSNPINSLQIQFAIQQSKSKPSSIEISRQGVWKAIYKHEKMEILVLGKGENLFVEIGGFNEGSKGIEFRVSGLKEGLVENFDVADQSSVFTFSQQEIVKRGCSFVNNQEGELTCTLMNANKAYIVYDTTGPQLKNIKLLQTQASKPNNNETSPQLTQFLVKLSIVSDQQTTQFAKQMLTTTLSSLCLQQSEYQGYQFYGFCPNTNPTEIDRHYSLLTIDILFKYNEGLAAWLTENFVDLLEEKLFYSFSGREWIPVPEHVEVFGTYLRWLRGVRDGDKLSESQFRKKINKVISIQNGLINNMLLSQVNHLSQEINYRQNNKVHPTILKMLTQAWKTDLPRARVSSIYAESFTNDFFYHQQDEKLDGSVGKMMWLIKLINQHVAVVRSYGDSFMMESLEQLVSLAKVMQGYVLDDPRAKSGEFNSIVETENMRIYTRSIGYESLLPFTYEISSVFPTTTMLNLTTSTGLSSMPKAHEKARQSYNFRGNVNLYFNYKILLKMISRCVDNPKLKVFYPGLKSVIESVQKHIASFYLGSEGKQTQRFFTSWTSQGKGVTAENYQAILNLAFLQDLNPSVQKNTKEHKQSKTKQAKNESTK